MRPLALNSHVTRTYRIRKKTNKLLPYRRPGVTRMDQDNQYCHSRCHSLGWPGVQCRERWLLCHAGLLPASITHPTPGSLLLLSPLPGTFSLIFTWTFLSSERTSPSIVLACSHGHPIFMSSIDGCMTFSTTHLQRKGFFLGRGIGICVPNCSLNISLST